MKANPRIRQNDDPDEEKVVFKDGFYDNEEEEGCSVISEILMDCNSLKRS